MALDFATCLSRLLTDERLRREFGRDAVGVANSLGLREDERASFVALSHDQLNRQAETLIRKRFHEVARWIPHTIAKLGEDAYGRFRQFATDNWPTGHRRHFLDAVTYCRYLRREKCNQLSRSEANRITFAVDGRRFALLWSCDMQVGGRRRRALQILFRRRGRVREWALYLG